MEGIRDTVDADLREMEDRPILPEEDVTALALMQRVYRNPNLPLPVRLRAARDALAFESPRLSVVATIEGFGTRLEEAVKRRMGYAERRMGTIDAPAEKVAVKLTAT